MTKDQDLFKEIKTNLFTAVVGDVMDAMGLLNQFLPPQIKPIRNDMVLVGRAMTVLETSISYEDRDQPYGLLFEALDDLKSNEVYLISGSFPNYALWGGLMSTRAVKLKAAGAVLNGYHRDTLEILQLDFPTFSIGSYAQDQGPRGKVVDFRCSLNFPNNVTVNPGDIVFGDIDGVVIIPQEHETEVIRNAIEKVHGENKVRESIEAGISAKDAFRKYGIM